jgi:rod shape-determining protein MreC
LLSETRTHGVVKGGGDFVARLDYVVNDEKVHKDETVLTSGEDRIFPKDLLIGTVDDFKPGNPFQVIHVRTAARLDRIEDVLILLTQQELTPKKTAEGRTESESGVTADEVAQPAPPAVPTYGSNSSQTLATAAPSPAASVSAPPNSKPGATDKSALAGRAPSATGTH